MQLSKKILPVINSNLQLPNEDIFLLPEKVLQFGTGVLLRGLPDFYIDKANKQHIFNGRIVVIKSTDSGGTDAFDTQDGLYTQCIRGVSNGAMTQEYIVNASISRVLSAKSQWEEIMEYVVYPNLEIIISNTTEVGLVLQKDDDIQAHPPASFPGKLLALLHKRYQHYNAEVGSGLIIIPTELVTNNGDQLRSILVELAELNKMEHHFIEWLTLANDFCNSLVDRIVPGKLPAAQQQETEKILGYSDELMIMSEPYSLWAIETTSPTTKAALDFAAVDETVIVTDDINKYRELKLRLLNGTHTFTCGFAYLAGFDLVKDAMADLTVKAYVETVMKNEIAPCICDEKISAAEANDFADKVIDRFSNPFIDHKWLSITLNYSQKMRMRNVPMLLKHYEKQHKHVPGYMAIGFAAFLLFMKSQPGNDGKYYGKRNDQPYLIQDEQAIYFYKLWKENSVDTVTKIALSDITLWGTDLSILNGFTLAVQSNLEKMIKEGAISVLKEDQWLQ